MGKRKEWIEVAQIISMLLIVLHHSLPNYCESGLAYVKLTSSIHYFSLSVFFFCSGYLVELSNRHKDGTYTEYVGKRACRLLIPYIGISLIMLVPKTAISILMGEDIQLSFLGVLKSFCDPHGGGICPHLWFLLALFILNLLMPILKRAINCRVVDLALLGILFAASFLPHTTTILSLDEIRLYAFYYVLGFFASEHGIEKIKKPLLWVVSIVCSGATIILIVFTDVNDVVSATISATGLLPILGFSVLMENHCEIFTSFFRGKSYIIFLLSLCVQNFVEVGALYAKLPWSVAATLMFLSGVFVPLLIYALAARINTMVKIPLIFTILGMKEG